MLNMRGGIVRNLGGDLNPPFLFAKITHKYTILVSVRFDSRWESRWVPSSLISYYSRYFQYLLPIQDDMNTMPLIIILCILYFRQIRVYIKARKKFDRCGYWIRSNYPTNIFMTWKPLNWEIKPHTQTVLSETRNTFSDSKSWVHNAINYYGNIMLRGCQRTIFCFFSLTHHSQRFEFSRTDFNTI